MRRSHSLFIRVQMIFLAALFVALGGAPTQAWTFKVIHSFCAKPNCADGKTPFRLLIDGQGNLLGMTTSGGRRDAGTLFELSKTQDGWAYHGLYSPPYNTTASLIMDVAGNFYGTTYSEGKYDEGSIFEFVRPQPGGKWRYRTLYSFCKVFSQECIDGMHPQAGLSYDGQSSGALYDGVSTLYGSVDDGGQQGCDGAVYQLTPEQNGNWRYKILHSFCGGDGAEPSVGGLLIDAPGHLLGTTKQGGASGKGVIFNLNSNAKGRNWRERVLYDFCSEPDCTDGAGGKGGLLENAAGDLLGTTAYGGACTFSTYGCGVLFKLNRGGRTVSYHILYTFCSEPDCADGNSPLAHLTMSSSGTVFGVTGAGGGNDIDEDHYGGGIIYSYDGSLHVLHAFCAKANCADGEYPEGLVMDAAGNLFGATYQGGKYGYGAVYELSP